MPNEWYNLPDGTEINIPDSATPDQLNALFSQLSTEFPDTIGSAWRTYGPGVQQEEEEEGNIFGALYQAIENIPRGIASVPLMGAQGIAALLTPHKDTAVEKKLRGAKDWLYSGIDPKYRDSKIAGIGMGVGQIVPMMLGGQALAALGVGVGVPAMLAARGIPMTSKAMQLIGGAKGVQSIAAGSLISAPMMMGDAATRISDYEERTGQDVSALKELAAMPPAALMGVFEMLPLSLMPGGSAASRKLAPLIGAGGADSARLAATKAFITGAATEAAQESTSELAQMATARALYDDEALAEMGSDMWDAGIIGGGAGGIVSVLTNLAMRGAGNRWMGSDFRAEDSIQREYKKGRRSMADPMDRGPAVQEEVVDEIGFLSDPEISEDERTQRYHNRIVNHYDQLMAHEKARAEQSGQEPITFTTERGSVYEVLPGQTTVRQRVVDEDTGLVDPRREAQPPSQKTFFVRPEDATRLSQLQVASPISYVLAEMPGLPGMVGIKVASGESAGQWVPGATHPSQLEYSDWLTQNGLEPSDENTRAYMAEAFVPYSSTPEVGLHPLESWVDPSLAAEQLATEAAKHRTGEGYGNTAHFGNVITEVVGVEPFVPQTPQELRAQAEAQAQADVARHTRQREEAQQAELEQRQDAGATFLELDELSGRSVEEIMALVRTETNPEGPITLETLSELILSDRLSHLGGDSRNELRDFAVRNAESSNRYNSGAVAAAVIGGIPSIVAGAETSSDLFGDGNQPIEQRFANAVNMLAPLLPETGALLTQQASLSPADINRIIQEASKSSDKGGIEGFNKKAADDLIYGFEGQVGMYDRVQRYYQDKEVEWRESDTGQLELRLANPTEQDATTFIQEVVGDQENSKVWSNHSNFEGPLLELLGTKNIELHANSDTGATKLDSDGFKALVRAVTGTTDVTKLTPGQRKALFGHIANMPTFRTLTRLPDLSRPTYTTSQMAGVLQQLQAKRDNATRKGPAWVDIKELIDATDPEGRAQEFNQAKQLVRHLDEAGYITAGIRKSRIDGQKRLHLYLNDDTRQFTVEATDADTDQERQAAEEKANEEARVQNELVTKISRVKAAVRQHLDRMNLPGLDYQLSADIDPVYEAIMGPEGIIANPENMAKSLAMLDGPNTRLWINLSQIDPDGTRPIRDIIQDLTEEVVHAYDQEGYWFENELNTMDSRAFDTVVPASVSEEGHKLGLNFVQFAEKLYPNLNQQDLMSEARAKYMTALAKDQIPRNRTAGKVRTLREKLVSFLTAGIESGRDTGMQDILSIFSQFQTGEVGRRGAPIPGQPRSLRLSRYADPRHIRELKKAIEEGDTDAEQRITRAILDEEQFNMVQSDIPELTWRDRLFNQFMMDEELANTKPGEIPPIGINASDRAINEYFRQKQGTQKYTMPEPIKHRFRNQERWAPSAELQDLVDKRAPELKADDELVGEVVLDALEALVNPLDATDQEAWNKKNEKQQLKETTGIITRFADSWLKPWEGLSKGTRRRAFADYLRRRIADGAYPVEKLGQLVDGVRDGMRSLADTSAIAALRWRNSAGNIFEGVLHKGAIQWIGDPLDGYHQFKVYDEGQETLLQMVGNLQSKQDREFAKQYIVARRFLDMNRKIVEAQAALDRATQAGDQANIGFFKQQIKKRPYKKGMKLEEQVQAAQEMVDSITVEAPHIIEFNESYQAHNIDNLDFMLSKGMITPEMHAFLQDMTYLPLYKDVGMMPAWPLGSNGRKGGYIEKWLQFGRMVESKEHQFDHAVEGFDNLENVDLVRNILYSEVAMIRDSFTNTAARRVVRDTQELTEKGFGVQSMQVDEAGPDVLRIMVDGQEEFHKLADPLLANATMMYGFSGANGFLQSARIAGQALRWGIINFPAFIYRNFLKDARHTNITYGGAPNAFFPSLKSMQIAVADGTLERAREYSLIAGGGGAYYSPQDLIAGTGPFQELMESDTPLGRSLRTLGLGDVGQRMARRSKQQERYEEISAELKEGRVPFRDIRDYMSFIHVMYRNMRDVGEISARVGVHDTTLAATGSPAQAMLDGLEVMNYGRRGDSPLLNAIISTIPFMAGGITGIDSFVRSHVGSPDALGAHLVDPRMNDEAAKSIRNRTVIRGLHMAAALFAYYMLMRDDEAYKRAGEVEKMNNYLIPIGDKYIKLPISFTAGMFYKAMPESILRMIDEEDYTLGDVGAEFVDQTKRNLDFHVMPQIMRPIWAAMRNQNAYTREPIVPSYMKDLPSEFQRTEYTSNMATGLAKILGVLPGDSTFSSPMKIEYMIRQYFGNAGMYTMLVSDRITREFTGQNIVGTRYDWAPSSLLTGEGIENFPVIGDIVGDWRTGRSNVDKFYELKEEVDIYVSIVNKLRKEGSPEEVQKWIADNVDTRNYRSKVNAFGTYMQRWRQRRDNLLRSTWITEDRKRELLFDMIEERDRILDDLTSVKAGMRGLEPHNWERAVI